MADNGEEMGEEIAEEIAEEIVEEIETEPAEIENDIDVTVVEIPEPPEPEPFATVSVGDLNITGPPALVKSITQDYLDKHIDHNPHDIGGDTVEAVSELTEGPSEVYEESSETVAGAVTPDIVEEQIAESVGDETHDVAPGPASWLYRPLGGRR